MESRVTGSHRAPPKTKESRIPIAGSLSNPIVDKLWVDGVMLQRTSQIIDDGNVLKDTIVSRRKD